ncbi:hypothetical protein ACFV4G_25130 [Kitasatospora sp. NPDC059747]|uniref:hypothetical protein n=1 Tax=Kitasatospora sp. NPDC059747 TaxID=3346930 RepID=UPI003663A112
MSDTYEIRLIDSRSPHFLLLECWGIWDHTRRDYLRVPGSSERIRRFYTRASAEAFRRHAQPSDCQTQSTGPRTAQGRDSRHEQ